MMRFIFVVLIALAALAGQPDATGQTMPPDCVQHNGTLPCTYNTPIHGCPTLNCVFFPIVRG